VSASGAVNTKRLRGRRMLRFESLQEVIKEAEVCAAAERSGRLVCRGNWTLGQTLGHLAFWADAPYAGYPPMRRMPWPLSMRMPLFKKRFVMKAAPAGVRIPGTPDGTLGTECLTTEEGLARLRRAFGRMEREAPQFPSPAFGPMTHEETILLNLRHAELHLSFLDPAGAKAP
jgi:hypothetical protein